MTENIYMLSIDNSSFVSPISSTIERDNDGITYLLVAVDVLSRYTWVEPLKNKTAKEVERPF
jgi:hypothetical protein